MIHAGPKVDHAMKGHAMKGFMLSLVLLGLASTTSQAGLFHHKKMEPEVPGGPPPNLVAPNGVEVPAWASKRMRESPVPLYGKSWGRRPWAMPLAQQNTPSARMARADQLVVGAGPIPGYTNGPPVGNYPTASVGPNGNGPPRRIGFFNGNPFPFNIYQTGD